MIAYKKDYLVATATVPHSEWGSIDWSDEKFTSKWEELYPNRTIMSLEWTSTGFIVIFSVLCDVEEELLG